METCYEYLTGSAANAAFPGSIDRKHMTQIPLPSREGNLNQEGITLGKV